VNSAAEIKLAVFLQDFGHVGGPHGEVGMIPVAQHPQALKFGALDVDELFGIGPAAPADLNLGQAPAFGLQLLAHLVLDGQAVAIPARHVGAVVARHLAGLDDDILENLIEGVPQVNVAVGIRRPVVQDKFGAPLTLRPDPAVQVDLGPAFEQQRLPPGQIGFHGKIGVGQVKSLFIIHAAASGIQSYYGITSFPGKESIRQGNPGLEPRNFSTPSPYNAGGLKKASGINYNFGVTALAQHPAAHRSICHPRPP